MRKVKPVAKCKNKRKPTEAQQQGKNRTFAQSENKGTHGKTYTIPGTKGVQLKGRSKKGRSKLVPTREPKGTRDIVDFMDLAKPDEALDALRFYQENECKHSSSEAISTIPKGEDTVWIMRCRDCGGLFNRASKPKISA